MNDQDYELLSAYIDNALADNERTALESRLRTDADLREELDALQTTVTLIQALPIRQAPRNFTLDVKTARRIRQSTRWLIFPTSATFSALSAAAAALLIAFSAVLLTLNGSAGTTASMVAFAPTTQTAQTAQTTMTTAAEDGLYFATDLTGTAPGAEPDSETVTDAAQQSQGSASDTYNYDMQTTEQENSDSGTAEIQAPMAAINLPSEEAQMSLNATDGALPPMSTAPLPEAANTVSNDAIASGGAAPIAAPSATFGAADSALAAPSTFIAPSPAPATITSNSNTGGENAPAVPTAGDIDNAALPPMSTAPLPVPSATNADEGGGMMAMEAAPADFSPVTTTSPSTAERASVTQTQLPSSTIVAELPTEIPSPVPTLMPKQPSAVSVMEALPLIALIVGGLLIVIAGGTTLARRRQR